MDCVEVFEWDVVEIGCFCYGRCVLLHHWKKGTILQTSTCHPWIDFGIRDPWITSLYAADKLVFEVARDAYVRTVNRAAQNVAQLEFCNRERKHKALHDRMRRIEEDLRESFHPWKVLPEVTRWDGQYEKLGRYLFLVLDGESRFVTSWL